MLEVVLSQFIALKTVRAAEVPQKEFLEIKRLFEVVLNSVSRKGKGLMGSPKPSPLFNAVVACFPDKAADPAMIERRILEYAYILKGLETGRKLEPDEIERLKILRQFLRNIQLASGGESEKAAAG
ncbi:MAG: hypothetical protein COV67_00700 [Nitrospinae bacterium CG11_big_fil_rev_8_21_14_0_20_56_8]|nr:MAG: hypothetical protein COV67_00700 [Nitrospinae bacterium CG11_big_fil_rev_8_21_14_0_20_56_8]